MLQNVFYRISMCVVLVQILLVTACCASSAHSESAEYGSVVWRQPAHGTAKDDNGTYANHTTAPAIIQTMVIYSGTLTYPAPHWISSPKEVGNFKASREQTKNTFTFEQIPKDQDFESWTMLYGVYGWHLPEYDFKRFIAESLNALALGCKEQAKSKLVSAEGGSVVMTYHCAALVDPLVKNGKDTESGFLYMSHVGSSYVKVYQAWRASNKDRGTPEWPVTAESVASAIERMKQITYTPKQ